MKQQIGKLCCRDRGSKLIITSVLIYICRVDGTKAAGGEVKWEGRPGLRWQDNIKMDCIEMEYHSVAWIYRDSWRPLVDRMMKL